MRRLGAVVAAVVAIILGIPAVAIADPARPTNFESRVTSVEPEAPVIDVRVIGGDAFLELTVGPGVSVDVPGYSAEPYLRFDDDGTVWANVHSPAHWLNMDRLQQLAPPPEASVSADPDWQQVAGDGRWAWHDHRIHWMSPTLPPAVRRDIPSEVFDWVVPMTVDGMPIVVSGTLSWVPSRSPFPWLAVTLLAAGGAALVTRRLGGDGPAALAAALALFVGVSQTVATPPDAGSTLALWLAPAAALVTAAASGVLTRISTDLVVGSLVMTGTWVLMRAPTYVMPVLATPLAPAVERAAVAIAAGCILGVGASLLSRMRRQPQPEPATGG